MALILTLITIYPALHPFLGFNFTFWTVLAAYQQENIQLNFPIYIFVGKNSSGEGFRSEKMGTLCTFLPVGEDFTRYEWPVNNQKVILYDTGDLSMDQLKKMPLILLNFKPSLIYIWSENCPDQILMLKRSFKMKDNNIDEMESPIPQELIDAFNQDVKEIRVS